MNLQDKLISLSDYKIGFTMYDEKFLVSITYKDTWSVIKPEDKEITFMKDEKHDNIFYYTTPLNGDPQHLQHIFDTIDETIAYNKELEDKVVLFNEKIEEMQDLFSKKPIDELRTIEFTFKTPKRKTTKRTNKKKAEKTSAETCSEEKQVTEVVKEKEETPLDIDKKIAAAMNKKKTQKVG